MNKRPHSVTVIGVLFLVAGVVGVGYHATEFKRQGPFQYDVLWVCLVRVVAIIAAAFLLRGHNWARWLLVIWVGYHVVLSGFHSMSEMIVHGLLLGIVAFWLFRPTASAYFRGEVAEPTQAKRDSMVG